MAEPVLHGRTARDQRSSAETACPRTAGLRLSWRPDNPDLSRRRGRPIGECGGHAVEHAHGPNPGELANQACIPNAPAGWGQAGWAKARPFVEDANRCYEAIGQERREVADSSRSEAVNTPWTEASDAPIKLDN